ncbi:MAG: AI-2E family transporter [Lachnospiraceae bacterium]|nr:AI-2E family transporter [Lachnospiraceae bacterium]
MKDNKNRIQIGIMMFFVIAASIVFFFAIYSLPSIITFLKKVIKILMPVNIGIFVAYILNPVVMFLNGGIGELLSHTQLQVKTRKKLAKGMSIGISLVLLLTIVITLLSIVIPEVVKSLSTLVGNIQNYGMSFYEYISGLFDGNDVIQKTVQDFLTTGINSAISWVKDDLLGQMNKLMSTLSSGLVGAFKTVINIILGLCVAVYLLISKHEFIGGIKKLLYAAFKKETVNVILAVGRETDSIFGGFISGKLIDSLIIGVLCFIGCSIMDTPYISLISVVIGVTNVVPIFGPWVGAIPCSLLVLVVNPDKALIFVIFIILLQQFDGNILGPNILGDSTGLAAFWVVVAITLGGGLFGVPGMLLGVPTFAVFYFLVKTFVEFKLKERNMPIQTVSYTKIKRIDPETLNSEFINTGLSKRERRKQNIFEDDVSREIAIAARLSKEEREQRGNYSENAIKDFMNDLKEGTKPKENGNDKKDI